MCRLLAFSAKSKTTIPAFIGAEFSQFLDLSEVHHDSWGIALDGGNQTQLVKKPQTAKKSEEFSNTINSESGLGGLLHFRWASPGLPVTQQNAHPFNYQDISFIHNGALSPYETLRDSISDEFIKLRTGETDSELFFLFLLTEIEKSGFVAGVVNAIRKIKEGFKYSSINSMILNSDYLIVVSEHDPLNKPDWADDVYYELRYRLDENGVAVASSGWSQEGWKLLQNHRILIVDRATLATEIINL